MAQVQITGKSFLDYARRMYAQMSPEERAVVEQSWDTVCSPEVRQMIRGGGAANLPAANGHECKCGGACGGSGACMGGDCPIPANRGDGPNGGIGFYQMPNCYKNCRKISRCLDDFLRAARPFFDEWSWLQAAMKENALVHYNTNVGANPPYNAAFPITSGDSMIFAQQASQQLPYEPGLIKIGATWTNNPAPTRITVRIWSGPRGVVGITNPTTDGLIQIGDDYTLEDFNCADDCYLLPFPELFGCQTSAIPFMRSLYFEFIADTMGTSEIAGLNTSIIKRYTREFKSCCDKYKLAIEL